ncbi:MAG: nucleoside hydrolase [Bariatricus sp.]
MTNKVKKKILIDTDLGDDVDDTAALIMALNSPELDIVGITTVYLDTVKRAEMVLELCSKYGRDDIPVCAGFGKPIIGRRDSIVPPIQYEILEEKRTNKIVTECDGAEFIIQKVKEYPELTIVAIGCMTNLGIAFYREPELMKNVEIIAMGGMFTNSAPEWNIKCDPEAAIMVMNEAEHLRMFGLDTTKYCLVSDEMMDQICDSNSKIGTYYKKGMQLFRKKTGYVYTLHDALLIVYLLDPSVAEFVQSDYTVELAGKYTRGSIIFKTNAYDLNTTVQKHFYYARSIDVEKFLRYVKERIY